MRLTVGHTWDAQPIGANERVTLDVTLGKDALRIDVDAPFHGDVPPSVSGGSTDRLWEFEVVELFVTGPGSRYTEIELGPHGHFLVLQLDGIRQPMSVGASIVYSSSILGSRWVGRAEVPRDLLPSGPWRVNAYAIHGAEPRRYLVCTPLDTPQPDFHRPGSFEVCLTEAG